MRFGHAVEQTMGMSYSDNIGMGLTQPPPANAPPKFQASMKPQRRPFQVEIKRGTSRSAFMSPNQSPDVFRKAEAQLFGAKERADAGPTASQFNEAVPPRRVLQAIEEPQAPLLPSSYDPPAPRGRKPGSKNRPKLHDSFHGGERPIGLDHKEGTPKRRGRPPGSKNRLLATRPSEILESASAGTAKPGKWHSDEQESYTTFESLNPRRRGRPLGFRNKPKDPLAPLSLSKKDRNALDTVGVMPDELAVVAASMNDLKSHEGINRNREGIPEARIERPTRERLRDRSKILRRYVWETEPKAGERGYINRNR